MKYHNDALQAAQTLCKEDVALCQKNYDANRAGQAERRCLIRAGFAFIEAWVHSCRYQSVLGEKNKIPVKVPATQNVEEALTELASILESSHTIDRQAPGRCDMKQAYKIRDRITHPKAVSDLHISDGDMNVFVRAVKWFSDTAGSIEEKRKTAPTTESTPAN